MGIAVDIVLLVVFLACVVAGVTRGAARTAVGLLGVVAAVMFSPRLGQWLSGVLPGSKAANFDRSLACMAVAFVLILVAAGLLCRLLDLLCRLPVLHGLNRILGGVFGAVKGVVVVLLLCALLRLVLPVLAVKYPDKVQLSNFRNSVVLQMQESPVSAASQPAAKLPAAGSNPVQTAIDQLPQPVRNPVYSFYEKVLREDVGADAKKK